MDMTRVATLGTLGAVLGATAWVSCIDMSGSRNDLQASSTSGTGGDDGGASGGSSSGGGGSSGAGGSSSGGGVDAAPATPDLCGYPATDAGSPIIYSGAAGAGTCTKSLPAPRSGSWFSYNDGTSDAGMLAATVMGGCGGTSLCAMHTAGPLNDGGLGYTSYGAGVGFDLVDTNVNGATTAQPYDTTPYSGIQYWVKGTTTGTRGSGNFAATPQAVHLKMVTATDRHGDDYGGYCLMFDPSVWTKCSLDFSAAKRDGFSSTPDPTTDTFDRNQMLKIQFEFSKDSSDAVTFDIWIDEISFY